MIPPSNPPDWADNANYSAGPYAGQPNKAYAPAGNRGEGFDPGAGVPMEWLNERLWNHGQWIDYVLDDFFFRESFLAPFQVLGAVGPIAASPPWATAGNNIANLVAENIGAGQGASFGISSAFPGAVMRPGTANSNNGWLQLGYAGTTSGTTPGMFYMGNTNVAMNMQWRGCLSVVGANLVTFNMGFDDALDGIGTYMFHNNANPSSSFQFRKKSTDTHYFAVTGAVGGAETSTDTGITPVAGVCNTFRISYAVIAGVKTVFYYIDGNLVATHTTNMPLATAQMIFGFGGTCTGAASNTTLVFVACPRFNMAAV